MTFLSRSCWCGSRGSNFFFQEEAQEPHFRDEPFHQVKFSEIASCEESEYLLFYQEEAADPAPEEAEGHH